jgi:hypothetical protein
MININYNDPTSIVRSNIGDPNIRFVSDDTITSALVVKEGDVDKASILIMETMLNHFSVQADESRTDEVEYRATKLYERFKSRLEEFKSEKAATIRIPILIGGTSLEERNRVVSDVDTFSPHFLDDWRTIQEQERLVEDKKALWDV